MYSHTDISCLGDLYIRARISIQTPVPKEVGVALLFVGFLFFFYVLVYLRSGFLGETESRLDFLITWGPYRFCRHPQFLSFFAMILGMDLMFRSATGVVFSFALSIPSVVYRGRVEDELLRNKFGEEWENYADEVEFPFPRLRRRRRNRWVFPIKMGAVDRKTALTRR